MTYTNWVDLIHLVLLSIGINYLRLIAKQTQRLKFELFAIMEETMPLNKKGSKIKHAMEKTYGKKKGDSVFYASENSGKIKGVKKHG